MSLFEALNAGYAPPAGDQRYTLKPSDVATIRQAYAGPNRPTQAALARKYGVSQGQISRIVNKKRWKD